MTWNLLYILTKGSQLDSISSESFRFLGSPLPLKKQSGVRGLDTPIKNIQIYISELFCVVEEEFFFNLR